MANIPNDVEEAIRRVEEFRATSTPQEQSDLERARAEINRDLQQTVEQQRREKAAAKLGDRFPLLANALRDDQDFSRNFPAIDQAFASLNELESLRAQQEDIERRIAEVEARSEATFAGANAVLEVRAKQAKAANREEPTRPRNRTEEE